MSEIVDERPELCKQCQQWLCGSRDLFCASCGSELIAAQYSASRLALDDSGTASFLITNRGLFRLYWAAEIITIEPGAKIFFTIEPDYGIVAPGEMQKIDIKYRPEYQAKVEQASLRNARAHLEVASNDPRQPEVKIAIFSSIG
jgi:hypothetical protein